MSKLNTSLKKYPVYGHAIGIVMQEDCLIRFPGDVGNATTFDYPVRYKVVKGVDPKVLKNPVEAIKYVKFFVEAAQELEKEGVRAIVGGCGFQAIYQKEMVEALNIPVFTSSLIQVPMVHYSLKRGKKVGIITANSQCLSEEYFRAVGWSSDSIPVRIEGMENLEPRFSTIAGESEELIKKVRENTLVKLSIDFIQRNPDIGAIVLECTNLPPCSYAIQKAVHLPVFDIVTLINWVYYGVTCKKYMGYL